MFKGSKNNKKYGSDNRNRDRLSKTEYGLKKDKSKSEPSCVKKLSARKIIIKNL